MRFSALRTLSNTRKLPERLLPLLASGLALVTSAAVALPTAAFAAVPPAPVPARLAGQVAATGQVLDTSGAAVAGAQVWLYAQPAAPVLTQVPLGRSVPVQLVGHTVSSSSGSYTVRVSSAAALRHSAGPGGIVNLELIAHTPSGDGAYSFPRRLVGGHALVSVPGAATSAKAGPEVTDLRIHATQAADSAPIGSADTACFRAGKCPCTPSETPWKQLNLEWGKLGATYGRYTGYTMYFTYTQGQSSSFGVGVSSSAAGGFSADGTYSTSTSVSQSFPTRISPASTYYRTEVRPEEYQWSYPPGCTGAPWYQTDVIYIAGGTNLENTIPVNAGHCVPEDQGSGYTENTTSASSFNTGVHETDAGGFYASAQTGYDNQASIGFRFTKPGWLCGLNNYPAHGPGLLVGGRAP